MFLLTYPAIVVATDNRLIATNIGFHAVLTTTLGWAAAIRCAGGALIDLSDWVDRGTAPDSGRGDSPALNEVSPIGLAIPPASKAEKKQRVWMSVKVHLGQ